MSIIKPDPNDVAFLSWGVLNYLNISSKGDAGGNWNGNEFELVFIVCVVEIFTTDGINFSAKSAKEPGIVAALTGKLNLINMNRSNEKNFKFL